MGLFSATGVQRGVVLLAGALLLPTLVLLGALLFAILGGERRQVEQEALAQAQRMLSDAEARLAADRAALRILSTSSTLLEGNEKAFRTRSAEVMSLSPTWRDIRIVPSDNAPATPLAMREGVGCPCVILSEPIRNRPGFSLEAVVSPDAYQALITGVVKAPTIAALVDHEGRFAARTLNYREKVGTPATIYVRRAIAGGQDAGIYKGVTYEGLENYTAFVRSADTGWSAHVAVQRNSIDGPRRWLQAAGIIIAILTLLTAAGLVAYSMRDFTIRRHETQSLLAMQRSEAMGQFTSGVAHDFRNMLTVIIGNLDRIASAASEPTIRKRATMALEAAKRGERLSNQLLSFARTDGAQITPIDLPELFDEIGDLLRQSAGPGVFVTWQVGENAQGVQANRDQLELALVNLVINARDAMNRDGRVTIISRRADGWVELVVTDTGPGVPPEVKPRLFEPFFTTKPLGKGTGLGLAQVAGAIQQAGGAVRVEDGPEGGAAFVLCFRPA